MRWPVDPIGRSTVNAKSSGGRMVLDAVARAFASRLEDFESACRSGSGSRGEPPAVDHVVGDLAHLFEDLARKELEAIRGQYFAPDGAPHPNRTMDYTPPPAGGETPDNKPDRTVDFTPAPDLNSLADRPGATGDFTPNGAVSTDFQVDPVFEDKAQRLPAIPGYAITGVLGRGGMGIVYKARQAGLNRDVALKMILKGELASSSAVVRFLTEARAIAQLNHPNIVQVYEINESDDLPYFSLEFCPGGSLDKALKKEPQDPRRAAELTETLARGLAVAHKAGVLHRDIKPANVLLDATGTPKITDFGLARLVGDDSGLTANTSVLGSPSYMPPEQASGTMDRVGPASDQYSLGATLYEFITGRPPFHGTTQIETLKQVRENEPLPPSKLQPTCPKDLETICLKAISKDMEKRYSSVEAFADDLKAYLEGRPIAARPVGPVERVWRWAKRNPKVAALSASLVGLAATLLVGALVAALVFRDKNMQLTKAFDDVTIQKKQSDENYAFARENGTLMIREMPRLIERQVLTQGAKADFAKIVRKMSESNKGGIRALPDRMMLGVLTSQGAQAYDEGDLSEAELAYAEAIRLAESLDDRETVERDKALGLVAAAKSGLARCRRARYFSIAKLSAESLHRPFAAVAGGAIVPGLASMKPSVEKDLLAVAIRDAEDVVRIQRSRLANPRSNELPENERRYNLGMSLAEYADLMMPGETGYGAGVGRSIANVDRAHELLSEAVGLMETVTASPLTEGTEQDALPALSDLRFQLYRAHRFRVEMELAERSLRASIAATEAAVKLDPSPHKRLVLARRTRMLGDLHVFTDRRAQAAEWDQRAFANMYGVIAVPELRNLLDELASDHYRIGTDSLAANPTAAMAHYRNCLRLRELLRSYGNASESMMFKVIAAKARCGETASVAAECDRIHKALPKLPPPGLLRNLGLSYGLCVLAAGVDAHPNPDPAERAKAVKLHTDRAIECFDRALVRLAELNAPKQDFQRFHASLEYDPDLDGIRKAPEFQALLLRVAARK
jgi:tRNA A-37 threonylcarbamoyl transferase component Bud32